MTELSIFGNSVGDEGTRAICEAIQSNKETKLASLNLGYNRISQVGVKSVTAMLAVTSSVTSVNVLSNQLNMESADLLLKVKAEKPNLRTLCGLTHDETELDLSRCGLGPGDAKLLAPEILVMGSITSIGKDGLNLKDNDLGGEGWGAIFAAVCSSKENKIASIDASYEGIGPSGAKLVAKALRESVAEPITGTRPATTMPPSTPMPLLLRSSSVKESARISLIGISLNTSMLVLASTAAES